MLRSTCLSLLLVVSACEGEPPPPDPLVEGWRAARAGDHAGAIPHYTAATEARPDDVEGWNGLARAQLRTGDPTAAMASGRKAAELAPDSPDAQELLGLALVRSADGGLDAPAEASDDELALPTSAVSMTRAHDAVTALSRALELDPERVRLYFALGRANELAMSPEEAAAAFTASAEAGVLPARSKVAAVHNHLWAIRDLTEERGAELRAELASAEELAGDDSAVRGAIAAERRNIDRKLAPPARFGIQGPGSDAEADARAAAITEAMNAGILGRLQDAARGPDAPWGASALGNSRVDSIGGLLGTRPLELSGPGGGGTGERGGPGAGTVEGLGGLGTRGGGTGRGYDHPGSGRGTAAMDED